MENLPDLEDLPDLESVTEIVPKREPVLARSLTRANSNLAAVERRREIEEQLYRQSSSVIQDALLAPELNLENEEENAYRFLELYGGDVDRAARARRIAQAAWSSKPPAFLTIAAQQLASLRRTAEESAAPTINAQVVVIQAPASTYPELVVENER